MFVDCIKRWAVAPLLLPLNRGGFEPLLLEFRACPTGTYVQLLSFVHGRVGCVAVATHNVIHVCNLESGGFNP